MMPHGSDLGIWGIIILGSLALALAIIVLLVSKDPEAIKAALVVAGVAGSAVSGLTGFIAGAHQTGQTPNTDAKPGTPGEGNGTIKPDTPVVQ